MTHTSTEQPEALRLAECLERDTQMNWPDYDNQVGAAAELRRLHARILELEAKVETGKRLLREEMARANRYAEAAQAQRAPLSDEAERHIKELTEIARMPNAEYVADAHNNAVRYLRGITQEKQG